MNPMMTPALTPVAIPASPMLPLNAVLACAMDRHLGPYDALPELDGWMGAEWCRCRRCGSPITRATSRRNAA
jgi:hypothetical protein